VDHPGDRGFQLLPRWLLVASAVMAAVILSGGYFMENKRPAWLTAHSFLTNVIAGLVGVDPRLSRPAL
jgi:hypothetical protein